jgi:hypothetical protein
MFDDLAAFEGLSSGLLCDGQCHVQTLRPKGGEVGSLKALLCKVSLALWLPDHSLTDLYYSSFLAWCS